VLLEMQRLEDLGCTNEIGPRTAAKLQELLRQGRLAA
jgi:hypothetical protein